MKFHHLLLCLLPILTVSRLAAEQAAPVKALTYHEALLKHPHNTTVFSRFYDAWIDSESVESLETFLKQRAESEGGIHHAVLARYQIRRGQDANALQSLHNAIESTPADPALLMERANLLIRSLDFPAARKDLETVTTLGKEALAIEAAKLIGKSHLREGNPQAAIQAWEKLLTLHPGNEDLLEDLVELAAAADQAEQALAYSEKLIAASTDPYKKALRLIRRGELLSTSGSIDQALAVWTDTLTQTGEGSWLEREILAHIERSFRRLDRLDLYTARLEELAKAHPRRLLIHRELAQREAASGNIDSAIGRFREVLRRSPGQTELREEFIRLLIQSERFDDASAELGSMLTATPDNAELHLRLAELAYQKSQANPDLDKQKASADILASLEKAHGFLEPGEASGLRIAQLMIRYGLADQGEALLRKLSAQPGASSAPAEALVAEYLRTKRSAQALEVLTELAKSPDAETVLRSTSAMAPVAPPESAFRILQSRLPEFQNNNTYLAAFIQASLSAKKPAEAIPSALRLLRTSKLGTEIHDSVRLAKSTITAAEKSPDLITELSALETRSTAETCLLAALLENQKDHKKSDALFQNTTDPTLLRFHSSLLSTRGDFKAAIAALSLLAGSSTEAGTSYFKELSDLQLRAGDSASCLKTLEQWKTASPTDKTPWTIATRLLRESNQYPKAIESARNALSRFPNDEDLTALLADLHQQAGDHTEAERIFWKLYDQAPDASAQSRWAARLSTLAHSQGRTAELKENFLQRSRGNRQSVGPILALIELARATRNEVEVLEYLHQALRIKPTDIDIRLQIATAEKQAGNPEQQIALLNEGLAQDTTGRLRTALAQALIDQGHVIKGMHMLRSLSGDQASDPRLIESAAISIANTGMIAEAIQYIQECLPEDMDWRTRFLLASLLQQDGRETEAADLYLTLIGENTEIPGLVPSPQSPYSIQRLRSREMAAYTDFSMMMQFISAETYQERNSRYGSDFQRILPTLPTEVRYRAMARLASLSNMNIPAVNAKINESSIPDLPFVADVISRTSEGSNDYSDLLEKHGDRPDLLIYLLQQGYNFDDPKKSKTSLLDIMHRLKDQPGVDDKLRLMLVQRTLSRQPAQQELWEQLVTLSEKIIQADPDSADQSVAEALFSILASRKDKNAIPASLLPRMKSILLRYAQRNIEERADIKRGDPQTILMAIHGMFGEVEPWIETANTSVRTHREKMEETLGKMRTQWSVSQSQRGIYYVQMGDHYMSAYGLPVTSIPREHLYTIAPAKPESEGYRAMNGSRLAATDLLPHLDKLESPVFRAWVALQSGNEKAIRAALAAKIPAIEADDFRILQTFSDVQSGKLADACRSLLALAESSADKPWIRHWAQGSFLSLCLKLTESQRKEFDPSARKILLPSPPTAQTPADPHAAGRLQSLAEAAQRLGFTDIHKSVTESLVAAAQQRTQPRSPPNRCPFKAPSPPPQPSLAPSPHLIARETSPMKENTVPPPTNCSSGRKNKSNPDTKSNAPCPKPKPLPRFASKSSPCPIPATPRDSPSAWNTWRSAKLWENPTRHSPPCIRSPQNVPSIPESRSPWPSPCPLRTSKPLPTCSRRSHNLQS
jgi:tetratricopeptide (TPR) repeat protein